MALTASESISMKDTLSGVFDLFEVVARERPRELLTNRHKRIAESLGILPQADPFGDFFSGTFNTFMDCADTYIDNSFSNYSEEERKALKEKYVVSQLGIGVIATFAELAPLICARDVPGVPISPNEAAEITANSYDFVESIIRGGDRAGIWMVKNYIRPERTAEGHWGFKGAVVDNDLQRPDRLEKFRLSLRGKGSGLKIVTVDDPMPEFEKGITTCPAHIYRDESLDRTYAKRLFDVMVNHARVYLYPDFIPLARRLMVESKLTPSTV